MGRLNVKICGMTAPENIGLVCSCSPDYIGFILYPHSKRYIDVDLLSRALGNDIIPRSVKKIGVFVNSSYEDIASASVRLNLDGVQLHGDESAEFCLKIKDSNPDTLLFKAIGVASPQDLVGLERYDSLVDLFIFDTKTSEYGGSGKSFQWDFLDSYQGETPFFLSGGIGPENIEAAIEAAIRYGATGLDVNSRCESSPGVKDITKVQHVMDTILNGEIK
jgi:phosphoribosylanthranilate isomerase